MRYLLFVSVCALITLIIPITKIGGLLCIGMFVCCGQCIAKLRYGEGLRKLQTKGGGTWVTSIVLWGVLTVSFAGRWGDWLLRKKIDVLLGMSISSVLLIICAVSSISILCISVCIDFLFHSEALTYHVGENACKGKERRRGMVTIVLLVSSVVICIQSPNNIFAEGMSYADSSVFQYIGWMMTNGMVPYRDIFDHKGPLVYFLNYIGMLLSFDYGVWIVEMVFMIATAVAGYRLARLYAGIKHSLIAVVAAFTLFAVYFEGGNLTEEWALPFIMSAMYIFMDYFMFDRISGLRVLLCGGSFACVLFLRVNMATVWIVFGVWFLIRCIREKTWQRFVQYTMFFMAGILAVGIPVVVYLYRNQALKDFIDHYLFFNIMYSGNEGLVRKALAAVYFMATPQFLAGIGIMVLIIRLSKGNDRNANIGYLVLMLVAVLMTAMSGYRYDHYGMVLIPLLIYLYSFFLDRVQWAALFEKCGSREFIDRVRKGIFGCIFVWWLGMLMACGWLIIKPHKDLDQIVSYIECMTDDDGQIIVFGNYSLIYLKAHRTASSKYFYQKPIAMVDERIADDFIKELGENAPEIAISYETLCDYEQDFLKNYEYECVNSCGTYAVYRRPVKKAEG